MKNLAVLLTAALAIIACADDIRDDEMSAAPDAGVGDDDADITGDERTVHVDNGDGTTTTTVDATSADGWVRLDLGTRAEIPSEDGAWELAFQRYHIALNGGASGKGEVEVAVLPGADFDTLSEAPAVAYLADAADGADEDSVPDRVMSSGEHIWYDYDPLTHVLSPRELVYVLGTEDGYFKLRILDYYDDAGTSGHLSFQWGPVAAPPGDRAPDQALTVDASDPQRLVHVRIGVGVVDIAEPVSSTDWDLALSRTMIATNGGTSGAGLGGARVAPVAFDALDAAPTTDFVVDESLPVPAPPGSGEYSGNPVLAAWYDYDPVTHAVSSRGETYVVRGATGDYGKLIIDGYEDGVYQLRLAPVAPADGGN